MTEDFIYNSRSSSDLHPTGTRFEFLPQHRPYQPEGSPNRHLCQNLTTRTYEKSEFHVCWTYSTSHTVQA